MKKIETFENGNSVNVFPDEETFQRIYGECLEKSAPPACEAVQNISGSYSRAYVPLCLPMRLRSCFENKIGIPSFSLGQTAQQ